jgi:DNA-binding response OmpR family regulator
MNPSSAKTCDKAMRVLVVDDDPIFRSLVATKLQRSGHVVEEAGDGAAAWSHASAKPFQLALVDLEMPHFKGIELIRCIRSHPRTCRMPIVVITSRNDAEAVRESLEAGATSFMTKPLNWSMFANHIEFLLRLHGAAERGLAAEERVASMASAVTELASRLDGVLSGITERITNEALAALESRHAPDGETRMAAALEAVAQESSAARTRLAEILDPVSQTVWAAAEPKPPMRYAS